MSDDPEVIIDGRRYVPAPLHPRVVDTPPVESTTWLPKVGQTVRINMDEGPPLGECIGYLDDPGKPRHGQPVIRNAEGEKSIIWQGFIWPFCPGSPEHKDAIAAGRFR